jgi:hypothetical protein
MHDSALPKRAIGALLFSASLFGLTVCNVQAATVSISGQQPDFFPGYGTASPNNNVVNSGLVPGSGVTDPSNNGSFYKGTGPNNPAIVTATVPLYNVEWYLAGAESGDLNRLTVPIGVANTPTNLDENNQNSNGGVSGANTGPLFLGTSLNQTSAIVNFRLTDVTTGISLQNGASNPDPDPPPLASLIFGYLIKGAGLTWTLTSTPQDWFLFAWNDGNPAGVDDNHDDFVGIGHIVAVPVPAALVLFASGLGLMGLLGRRRKIKAVHDFATAT